MPRTLTKRQRFSAIDFGPARARRRMSMTPSPVMATRSRSHPARSARPKSVVSVSEDVAKDSLSRGAKSSSSGLARRTEPAGISRRTPLRRRSVPLRHVPGGRSTVPPAAASIVRWIAAVSSLSPSPRAPNWRTSSAIPRAVGGAPDSPCSAARPGAATPMTPPPRRATLRMKPRLDTALRTSASAGFRTIVSNATSVLTTATRPGSTHQRRRRPRRARPLAVGARPRAGDARVRRRDHRNVRGERDRRAPGGSAPLHARDRQRLRSGDQLRVARGRRRAAAAPGARGFGLHHVDHLDD